MMRPHNCSAGRGFEHPRGAVVEGGWGWHAPGEEGMCAGARTAAVQLADWAEQGCPHLKQVHTYLPTSLPSTAPCTRAALLWRQHCAPVHLRHCAVG